MVWSSPFKRRAIPTVWKDFFDAYCTLKVRSWYARDMRFGSVRCDIFDAVRAYTPILRKHACAVLFFLDVFEDFLRRALCGRFGLTTSGQC